MTVIKFRSFIPGTLYAKYSAPRINILTFIKITFDYNIFNGLAIDNINPFNYRKE